MKVAVAAERYGNPAREYSRDLTLFDHAGLF
jgi:hypothetical protein